MKIRSIVLITFVLASLNVFASSRVEIDNDESDCLDGWISMDVTIEVEGEEFDFNPSCSFSFRGDFETKSGVKCEIRAGMCSAFSPEKRLEVKCDDGSREDVEILCPKK